jgi:tRNA nucleotidyltransferase (CCA-adding enzyme)
MTINTSKLVSPLTIVDPVQKSRNVSAALSKEKYDLFKIACRKFIKNPSEDFFTAKEITIDELKKKAGANKLICLEVEPDKGKVDVIGSRLLKAFEFIGKKFSDNDFGIVNQGWKWNKSKNALFWYIIETKELSEFVKWAGPPVKAKQFAESFRKAHKNEKVFEEKGRLFANVKRKFTIPEKLAEFAIKDEWLKDKAKKIKII